MRAIFILLRKGQFSNLLFHDCCPILCKILIYHRGGFTILQEKKYYNQKDVIQEIHNRTGCSINDISIILNSLCDVVKDKFSDSDDCVEIKLFPGLKVTSRYIPPEQSKSNLDTSKYDFVLRLGAIFSDYFKKEIRNLHRNTINNL